MERVYHPHALDGDRLEVTGPEAHHLARVRRVGPGDRIEVFDGLGGVVLARVDRAGRNGLELVVEDRLPPRPLPTSDVTLATAVPKGDRFDWLIEKATELGVARIIPLRTQRSVVDPRTSKLDRLRRLVVEACKQSGRDHVLQLEPMASWSDFLATEAEALRLIAHPGGDPIARHGPAPRVVLAIGPEGGFTDEEIEAARAVGWRTIGLGPNLLRIETAGIAASAAFLAMGGAAP
ncbi:RsmE family RNA methyltransferase [Tautonia sp. JC769]|uniref:RsmE family RNA methyltransferase n=1 Tax=Tautonia sp. JC769 TaxID=3232135 RepID=UPI0034590FFF